MLPSIMKSFLPLAALTLLCLDPVEANHHHRRGLNPAHIRELNSRAPAIELAAITPKRSNKKRCKKGTPKITGVISTNSTNNAAAKPKASSGVKGTTGSGTTTTSSGCFPALGFKMPSSTPDSTDGWWCNPKTEYAFVGFSYEVSACQSKSDLTAQFKDIRNRFNGRYVRLYGACDRNGFYDDVIDAAWSAGVGVHALIWFGFEGGNIWQTRRDSLLNTLKKNPRAPFVTRVVQFGSEPLFDSVLSAATLAQQVRDYKAKIKYLGIPVTVSDMAWSYQKEGGSDVVLEAIDFVDAHTLPYFAGNARGGASAWTNVAGDISWFMNSKAAGKKIYLSQNGWPSQSSEGVQANSRAAFTSIQQEKLYFDLLDSQCSYFKNTNGGIGWFAHIYSDDQEPGYGILYNALGNKKFDFSPKTHC